MSGYQSDITGGGIAAPNQLFVEPVNGNDLTGQKGDAGKPFKTGLAAEAAAVSGDVILFLQGTHTDVNLGKDGLIYYDEPGAIHTNLVNTDPSTYTDAGKGPMSFKVLGYGEYIHDRQWNVNNWNIEFVTLTNAGSKVDFECYKAVNTGNDGSHFKALNGSIVNVKAEELQSGSQMVFASGAGSIVSVKARKADISLYFQTRDGGKAFIEIDKVNAGLPHLFTGFKQMLLIRNGGVLEFKGEASYTPTAPISPSNSMIINQNPGGPGKSILKIKGIINLLSGRLFGFTNGAKPDQNIIQFEGEINLGLNSFDDVYWINASGTLITKNLVVRSENITRATGIIPANKVELHAENTTIVLSDDEIALGAKAISSPAIDNVNLKSFFSNAPTDPVTNLIAGGIVDTGNISITQ